MKKIFISIPWFSPAYKAGGPIQSISQMIEGLKEGYEFFIYTSNEDLNKEKLSVAQSDIWVPYNNYTQVLYASTEDRSQRLIDAVAQVKPDILYIVGMFDWHFNIVPMIYAKAAKKIVSVKGMLHPGALQQKAVKKKIFIEAMRLYRLGKKCVFHATDQQEAAYVKKNIGDTAAVHIAGNFARSFAGRPGKLKTKNELDLLSIGIISPMKNYLLVLRALQQVNFPIHYDIYGAVKDVAYWHACEEIIAGLPEHIQVRYHGELKPDLVEVVLQEHDVFILPSESENFGHAIAEALSAGLPAVSSQNVPWIELEQKMAGKNVERNIAALAEAIAFFAIMDESAFSGWRKGAKEYIESRMDQESLKREYEDMFG